MTRGIMGERLRAADERNAEAENAAPIATSGHRLTPMVNEPSLFLTIGLVAVGLAALVLIGYVLMQRGEPEALQIEQPAAATAVAPEQPTNIAPAVEQAPAEQPAEASPAEQVAPTAEGAYLEPINPGQQAPAGPAAPPAAPAVQNVAAPAPQAEPVYAELVPVATEPAVRSCENTGRGVCRGERP